MQILLEDYHSLNKSEDFASFHFTAFKNPKLHVHCKACCHMSIKMLLNNTKHSSVMSVFVKFIAGVNFYYD